MTTPCKFKNGTCVHCGDTTQGQCEGWNGSDTNALMAAARLALDALYSYSDWEDMGDHKKPASDAIEALKKAGVAQ